MAEIMFSFSVCHCVCLCTVVWSVRPVDNFSKMVKATDFKFDMHVFRDSPYITLNIFRKEGVAVVTIKLRTSYLALFPETVAT